MILIISDSKDAHCTYVCEKLSVQGVEAVIVDTSLFPSDIKCGFLVTKTRSEATIEIGGRRISNKEIVSVWNRRKLPTVLPESIKTSTVREYISQEAEIFLENLQYFFDVFWVNNPDAVAAASRKPYQLLLARNLGLDIPDTLVGNSSFVAEGFLHKIPEIALKTIGTSAIEIKSDAYPKFDCLRLFTRKLTCIEVKNFLPHISNCPVILQPYVQKNFELRITVVGNQVFACAIYSQATERTKEDWRRYDLENTPHEPYKLPSEVERKCIDLVRNLGLVFGCIDMIVTPDNKYVFLEINPNGQWLWIERLAGMPIGEALANMLSVGRVI